MLDQVPIVLDPVGNRRLRFRLLVNMHLPACGLARRLIGAVDLGADARLKLARGRNGPVDERHIPRRLPGEVPLLFDGPCRSDDDVFQLVGVEASCQPVDGWLHDWDVSNGQHRLPVVALARALSVLSQRALQEYRLVRRLQVLRQGRQRVVAALPDRGQVRFGLEALRREDP